MAWIEDYQGPCVDVLLIIMLFGLLVAGGLAVAWQARAEARLVERDLTAARDLLGRAGGFSAGKLDERLALADEAASLTAIP